MKYYFISGKNNQLPRLLEDFCHTKKVIVDAMKEDGIDELIVFEAKIEFSSCYFFCNHFFEVGEKNDGCGKFCEAYNPRNKKSGRCVHSSFCYECTEIAKI